MNKFSITFLTLIVFSLFCSQLLAQTPEEVMDRGQVAAGAFEPAEYDLSAVPKTIPLSTEFAPLIATINVEALTGSNLCLGVEYAFGYLWVTNAGALSTAPPNYLVKIDISGPTPVVVNTYTQSSTTGWGWRDLCADANYLYASEGTSIIQIDPATGSATGVTIPSPIDPARALAYDPATDHFWTISFSTNLFEIDRSGTVIHSFTNPVSCYGAGWDPWSMGGPYIWLNAGTATGDTYHMDQVNPVTGLLTGVSHIGTAAAIAGGLDIDVDIVPGKIAAVALGQGTPDIVDIWDFGDYGDLTDPLPPTNFVATSGVSTPTSMLLTWTDPAAYINGNPLTNFQIIIARDNVVIDSVNSSVQTYTNTSLTQYQEYMYQIWAKDNLDSTSSKVSATWMAGGYPPVMVVDPLALGDTLLVGATSQHEFTIYNNQASPGPLDYTITENPAVPWLSVSPVSGTVAPSGNQVITVDIVTSGMAAGNYTTDLVVAGNDPFNPDDIVVFTLQVNEAPIVGFFPDSLHFTLDPTGVAFPVTDSSQITITNTGLGPLDWTTGGAAPELMYYKFDEVGTAQTHNFADPTSPVPTTAQVLGLTMGGTGFSGAAVIGNGLTSTSNYVNTGWVTNLGTSSWTIEMWLNNAPSNTTLYYLFGDNTAGSFRCFLGGAAGAGNLLLRRTGMTDVVITGVAPGPSIVTFVYDASVPEIRGYLNGTLVTTVAQVAQNIIGTANFKVAGYSTSVGMAVGMLMDEFKMYNRAIDVTDASRQGWLTTSPQSGSIAPGGSQNVWVIADATGLIGGEYKGEVHIMSNDPVHPDTTLPVGLTVFGTPQIAVDPLTLTFDTLLVGASQTLPVTVSNTGSFPLNVTNVTTSNADFGVVPLSFTVGVGEADTIDVTFNPSIAQLYTEIMSIFSDDPVTPVATVNLVGLANDAPIVGVTPDTFDVTLTPDSSTTRILTISNTGVGPLDFTVSSTPVLEKTSSTKLSDVIRKRAVPHAPVNSTIENAPTSNQTFMLPDVIDGEEIFGSMGTTWSGTLRDRGNVFQVTTATTLSEHKMYLSIAASTPMYFFVYQGAAVTGSYTKISEVFIANSGTGEGFYSSGPISVPLQVGSYYYIGASWQGNATYYRGTETVPIPCSFGFLSTGIPGNIAGGYPPAATATNTSYTNFSPYYCAIVTGASTEWLSFDITSGQIPAGGSQNVTVTFDPTGLLGGDYRANILVESNDPVNPEVAVGAHMLVIGQAVVAHTPDPVVMDTTFTGATDVKSLWVKSIGSDTLRVTDILSTNPIFSVDTTHFNVGPPSDSFEVQVSFSPIVANSYQAYLLIQSNDPVTPVDSVMVTGVAAEAPLAVVSPSFQNPVFVPSGDSTTVFINLSNAGGSPLVWSAMASNVPVSGKRISWPTIGPVEQLTAAEYAPEGKSTSIPTIETIWDIQFSFDLLIASGANGNAGAEFDGTYYYSTRWASALLHKYDLTGALVEEFSIPGVTGLRDLAFDGTYMYGGANATTIYMMDFVTKTLIGTIPSPIAIRSIAYDDVYDAFWVANWATDIALVDRSGNTLASIPAASHGLSAIYGTAYDNFSDGGPYLWIFDQGPSSAGPQAIYQFSLTSLAMTGVSHDVLADFPQAGAAAISGGLFVADGIVAGKASIGGILQGTPDIFFVYELAETAPDWIRVLTTAGTISPMDQFDIPIRIYQNATPGDTAYVNIYTNDPALPVTSVLVIRTMVTGLEGQAALPTTFDISQNYPNPFNPTTSIKYQLPQTSDVRLLIYNVLGQKVRTLINKQIEAGYHSVIWDGRNDVGSAVASGVYIYRFEAGDFTRTMKLMLLK